jgi:hypothetical protein
MLNHVSRRGSMCHLMVASHNEESIHQATKRYERDGKQMPTGQGRAEGGGDGDEPSCAYKYELDKSIVLYLLGHGQVQGLGGTCWEVFGRLVRVTIIHR